MGRDGRPHALLARELLQLLGQGEADVLVHHPHFPHGGPVAMEGVHHFRHQNLRAWTRRR